MSAIHWMRIANSYLGWLLKKAETYDPVGLLLQYTHQRSVLVSSSSAFVVVAVAGVQDRQQPEAGDAIHGYTVRRHSRFTEPHRAI